MKEKGVAEAKGTARSGRSIFSIRWIVSGGAAALIAVTVLAIGGYAERDSRQKLTHELKTRLVLHARNIALTSAGALLSEFPELTLQPILSEMQVENPEFTLAIVVDHEGIIRGHPQTRRLGTVFEPPSDLQREPDLPGLLPGETFDAGETMFVATVPVLHVTGERIGSAIVGSRRDPIDNAITEARKRMTKLVAVLLGVAIALALALMGHLLRPVSVLRSGLERIGAGDLETPVALRSRTEFGLLADTVNRMTASLRRARAEMLEKERMERELELAREIQAALLPAGTTETAGFVIAGSHRAAAEVGGDYYDIFELPDGRIGLAIADVSGKGLAGCMVTSMLAALLRACREATTSPRSLLVTLENHLVPTLRRGTFVTMFYGLLDPTSGKLTYASAGHSPLLVYRATDGRVETFRTKGIPLGAVRGGALAGTLEDQVLMLDPGDLLVQYTDGVNEAFEPQGEEQFGFERLERAVRAAAPQGCRAVIESIRTAVRSWIADGTPHDDETLLVASREGVGGAPRAPVREAEVSACENAEQLAAALEVVARARHARCHIGLSADVNSLVAIRDWIRMCPDLSALRSFEKAVLETAVYEICANIAEHGYQARGAKSFDLWWVPSFGSPAPGASRGATDDTILEAVAARVRDGVFVVVDHGVPFEPGNRPRPDFQDPAVRRRGRGIGLEIIRSAMQSVEYYPGTTVGNITLMKFDPAQAGVREEKTHA
jgi:serine phosphatase RsbU (regulator of sigma subunit)/anti-sigma regulatory factor (Ser/Thr protein kinase)